MAPQSILFPYPKFVRAVEWKHPREGAILNDMQARTARKTAKKTARRTVRYANPARTREQANRDSYSSVGKKTHNERFRNYAPAHAI